MDQFGADPQVRAMRQVFRQMEEHDLQSAQAMNLVWTDTRLRTLRQKALAGHQAQLSRLAAQQPMGAEIYLEAYRASFKQAAIEMGLQPPDGPGK